MVEEHMLKTSDGGAHCGETRGEGTHDEEISDRGAYGRGKHGGGIHG